MFWPGNSGVLAQASGRVFELGLQLLKLNVFKQKYQYYIYIYFKFMDEMHVRVYFNWKEMHKSPFNNCVNS